MKRKALSNIAASSLIVAGTMAGCSGAALNDRAGASAGKMQQMADSQARSAEEAIAKGEVNKAVQIAEAAVAANPDSAAHRTLLGRAYLASGRFDSAATAFDDALTLGATDSRTIVNLALVRVAQGRSGEAQKIIVDHVNVLPAADYGLAMAMAGDPQEAVRVLSRAIQDPAAGAKERQNLAYSYALAGQWREAGQVASVDLPPLEAAERVAGWARFAQPGAERERVIAMMGVAPRDDDAGLPVRLALGSSQPASSKGPLFSAPIQTADAGDVLPLPAMEPVDAVESFDAPVEMAQAEPAFAAPVQQPVNDQPVEDFSLAFQPAPKALKKNEIPSASLASIWRPVDPESGSAWVVQLGAFSTPENAKAAWTRFVSRNEKLAHFPYVPTTAMVNGRQFYRVAIAGFGDRSGAHELCEQVRAYGGVCFVRLGGTEAAPSRWALAKTPELLMASR